MLFRRRNANSKPNLRELYDEFLMRFKEEGSNYRVRLAEERDLTRVMDINYRCLPENYPYGFFHELWSRYGKAFYVAETAQGEIVGYVMCRVEYKPGFYKLSILRSGHIVSLAVVEEHRKRGLGFSLMINAMKSLYDEYGCEETYLEVRVSNNPAISLYRKLGYEVVKVIKNYYLDGEDAYLMARPLP